MIRTEGPRLEVISRGCRKEHKIFFFLKEGWRIREAAESLVYRKTGSLGRGKINTRLFPSLLLALCASRS